MLIVVAAFAGTYITYLLCPSCVWDDKKASICQMSWLANFFSFVIALVIYFSSMQTGVKDDPGVEGATSPALGPVQDAIKNGLAASAARHAQGDGWTTPEVT